MENLAKSRDQAWDQARSLAIFTAPKESFMLVADLRAEFWLTSVN
jgi:hypothetical protein